MQPFGFNKDIEIGVLLGLVKTPKTLNMLKSTTCFENSGKKDTRDVYIVDTLPNFDVKVESIYRTEHNT